MNKPRVDSVESSKAVVRAHRERCADLTELIRRKMADIRDGFFEMGGALAEINNNALFKAAGHKTFVDYLDAENLLGVAQAHKLIAVAELVPREDAVQLGPEKSYAVTQFARTLPAAPPIAALLRRRDLVDGKSVQQLSVRQLTAATREQRQRTQQGRAAQRRADADKLARAAQAALRRQGVHGVAVSVGPSRGGQVFNLTLTEQQLRALARIHDV